MVLKVRKEIKKLNDKRKALYKNGKQLKKVMRPIFWYHTMHSDGKSVEERSLKDFFKMKKASWKSKWKEEIW